MKHLKTYKKFYESIGSPLLDLSNNVDNHLISVIQKDIKTPSKVLEISCGNGSDSLKLQELGYEVTCTELNSEYVKNAKDSGLNCIQHNSEDKFPFSDDEFDLVYSRLGLHYFTEEELNGIFSELKRIGKKILITIKVVDDIKTGKVILTEEKWKEIVSRFFNIKSFEVKEGQLYGSQSKWIEIEGDSLENTFEDRVYMKHLKKYKIFESSKQIMYHITQKKNIDSILREGLLINQPLYMTESGSWSHEVYGCNPIFLSSKPESTSKQKLLEKDDVVFEVDVTGLDLVVDLPGLVDWGAYLDDDLQYIWFKRSYSSFRKQAIDILKDYFDEEGLIWFEDLLNPNLPVTESVIEMTGSAAFLKNISPERLKLNNNE